LQGRNSAFADENKKLTVISPIEGSPASKAGVCLKDIIIKINDQSTRKTDVNKAIDDTHSGESEFTSVKAHNAALGTEVIGGKARSDWKFASC
jgi:C-terminal processing protease CtpA/Prc